MTPMQACTGRCGFGGTLAMKNAEVSIALDTLKPEHVLETGAEFLLPDDSSCWAA